MTGGWGYAIAGWIVVFGSLGAFALATIRRGRRLSRQVPAERRRWS